MELAEPHFCHNFCDNTPYFVPSVCNACQHLLGFRAFRVSPQLPSPTQRRPTNVHRPLGSSPTSESSAAPSQCKARPSVLEGCGNRWPCSFLQSQSTSLHSPSATEVIAPHLESKWTAGRTGDLSRGTRCVNSRTKMRMYLHLKLAARLSQHPIFPMNK